jgi:hypothetical protein
MAEPTNEPEHRIDQELLRADPPEESRRKVEATADREVENYRDEYDCREGHAGCEDLDHRS